MINLSIQEKGLILEMAGLDKIAHKCYHSSLDLCNAAESCSIQRYKPPRGDNVAFANFLLSSPRKFHSMNY